MLSMAIFVPDFSRQATWVCQTETPRRSSSASKCTASTNSRTPDTQNICRPQSTSSTVVGLRLGSAVQGEPKPAFDGWYTSAGTCAAQPRISGTVQAPASPATPCCRGMCLRPAGKRRFCQSRGVSVVQRHDWSQHAD